MRDGNGANFGVQEGAAISLKTLRSEIGDKATTSAIGRYRERFKRIGIRTKELRIPNHEDLRMGDVILTHTPASVVNAWIYLVQTALGREPKACVWEHAALYVGNLHVIESRPFDGRHFRSGLVLNPLTLSSADKRRRIVLRHSDPQVQESRFELARNALMDFHLNRRRYGFRSLFRIWKSLRTDGTNIGYRAIPDYAREATCSEYILETYVSSVQVMVDEYISLRDGEHRWSFLPADLYQHQDFNEHELKYYRLLED